VRGVCEDREEDSLHGLQEAHPSKRARYRPSQDGTGESDEAAFRLALAFDVLIGRMPRQVERRWWNRAAESPVLIDVYD
jgi:L-alanine-DL-glutamate epimerase-like enolase superfamily enzyme